jgi:chemotaxis protein MotB
MPMKGNLSKTSDKVGRSIVPQLMSGEEAKTLGEIQGQIEDAMKSLIDEELISLRRGENFLEVIINSNILFPSGSSILSNDATVILADLADVLSKYANFLHVEGYTDNVPINNIIYPSNWELSAARAASVVHLFSDRGVKPELMAAIGFGEYRPTEDNASAAGRQANRRVVVVVMGPTGAQEQLDLQRHEGGEAQAAAPKPASPPGMVDVQLPVEVYESLPNDIANILRPGEAPLAGDENTTVPPSDVVEIVPPGTINPIELPAIEPAGER